MAARLAAPLLLLLWACSSPLAPSQAANGFVGDFETGDLAGWGQELARDESAVIVTDPVRRGRYAVRFTLRPGDIVSNGHRAEISHWNRDPYKKAVYYGWSFMIDEGYAEDERWQLLVQFHDQPDRAAGETWETLHAPFPPLALVYHGGNAGINIGTLDRGLERAATFRCDKGRWTDMVFHVKWSVDEDGFVEAWKDGRPVTPFNGSDHKVFGPTAYNRAGNYLKIGLYRHPGIASTNVVTFDEVRIGAAYEDVAL